MHTPYGVRDYLPYDCYMKRELEHAIESVFHKSGYLSVMSPTFEHIEVYDGKGSINQKQMYKFIDKDGEILALRSDFTPAIGRMVASNFHKFTEPIRICYTGSIFRYNKSYQAQLREYTQSGVELLGDNSPCSTMEVLLLAVNALQTAGLKIFKIALNQVDFIKGVLDEAGFSPEDRLFAEESILKKDFISLSDFVADKDIPETVRDFLQNMPLFIGGEEIIDEAAKRIHNAQSQRALEEMRQILREFDAYGLSEYVELDLNMLGNLDYYTGLIFSGYTQGSGFSIIDGGRYDTLMSQFGADLPSIGFSININELMIALKKQGTRLLPDVSSALLFRSAHETPHYFSVLKMFLSANIKIENSFHDTLEEAIAYATKKNIANVLHFINDEKTQWIDLQGQKERILEEQDLSRWIESGALLTEKKMQLTPNTRTERESLS